MSWARLCKRTNYPKLGWLMEQLKDAGIEYRLNGYSFHAPILEVRDDQLDMALGIPMPIDDVPDDDPQFKHEDADYPQEAV